MVSTLVLLFLVCHLRIVSSQANESTAIIEDIDSEWKTFTILTCAVSTPVNLSLFECLPPENDITVIDISCLANTTFGFDEAICRATTVAVTVAPKQPFTCENQNIGLYCNISSDACQMSTPCRNQATCYPNNSLPLNYSCQCKPGYFGYDCDVDNRVCKERTCWHDGKCVEVDTTVSVNNQTTFKCECTIGYDGHYCELTSNMCENITCENGGVCFSSYLSWRCVCLGSTYYSGLYCEKKSSGLLVKQILSKSFATIAIVAIATVFTFVIVMDVLKYVFKIDPVDRERKRLESEYAKRKRWKQMRKSRKKYPRIALRFLYVA